MGRGLRRGPVDARPDDDAGRVALRLARSYSPEQTIGPTNFLPTQLQFPETPGVDSFKRPLAARRRGL